MAPRQRLAKETAEQAGWEEGYEEVEEQDSGADYVTEMLGARRRRLQTACDTVEPLGSAVGVGGAAVTFATDGTDATFVAGPAAVGAYVDGSAITAADMTAAVDGTFSCNTNYTLDTTVTFVCGVANGAATLSAQPCALEADAVTTACTSWTNIIVGVLLVCVGLGLWTGICKASCAGRTDGVVSCESVSNDECCVGWVK